MEEQGILIAVDYTGEGWIMGSLKPEGYIDFVTSGLNGADDLGISNYPEEPGVYLWRGDIIRVGSDPDDEPVYTGTYEVVLPDMLNIYLTQIKEAKQRYDAGDFNGD